MTGLRQRNSGIIAPAVQHTGPTPPATSCEGCLYALVGVGGFHLSCAGCVRAPRVVDNWTPDVSPVSWWWYSCAATNGEARYLGFPEPVNQEQAERAIRRMLEDQNPPRDTGDFRCWPNGGEVRSETDRGARDR